VIEPEFFEQIPLYKKYPYQATQPLRIENELPKINMPCPRCRSNRTFQRRGVLFDEAAVKREPSGSSYTHLPTPNGALTGVWYQCLSCEEFRCGFMFRIADDGQSVTKVGQYPPWSIEPELDVKEALGDHLKEYKKGLICESQGFGIGAFSYYRRIVEMLITGLLDDIGELIKDEAEHRNYMKRLSEVRDDYRAEVKIEVVKDLLPPILRPSNINPLADLHGALSMGLHSESDEDCLALAESIRASLAFLVGVVRRTKREAANYTSSMESIRKKLEKRKPKSVLPEQREETDSPHQS
jgi:hypothetical protein